MWERFTERAKYVVSAAREEAAHFKSEYVRAEHLLLGLCRETEGVAVNVLRNLGVDIEALTRGIRQQCRPGTSTILVEDIEFTPHVKLVLELAIEEASRLNSTHIGTEHILLGLIKEGEGITSRAMVNLNIDLARARFEVIRLSGGRFP